MPKTVEPFNVNSSVWTPYVVQVPCRKIRVSEVGQAGTADYYVSFPEPSDTHFRTIPAGKEFPFDPGWRMEAGDTPFYLKMSSGSVNFDGDEQ